MIQYGADYLKGSWKDEEVLLSPWDRIYSSDVLKLAEWLS